MSRQSGLTHRLGQRRVGVDRLEQGFRGRLQVDGRVLREGVGRGQQQDPRGDSQSREMARGNQSVTAVVALAAQHEHAVGRGVGIVLQQCLDEDPRVLKAPEAVIAVSELGDSSVNLVVRPWCTKEDYWALRFDLTRKIKERLEANGCSIPFPQTDVHLHQVAS